MSIYHFDRIRQKIAYKIADALAKTKIAPHHITFLRFIVTAPLCAYFFSRGDYFNNLIGLTVYVGLTVFDWVDGRLARITGQLSALGKWLDETTDRILVLIVLTSIFYSGIVVSNSLWFELAIIFYTLFFFLAVINNDFDRMFNLEFDKYPDVEKKMFRLNQPTKSIDRLLINFLFVHRNPVSQFFFCISYPLFLGIITNQLFIAFIFITTMLGVRGIGFLLIMYRVVKKGNTASTLTKVLREYYNRSLSDEERIQKKMSV